MVPLIDLEGLRWKNDLSVIIFSWTFFGIKTLFSAYLYISLQHFIFCLVHGLIVQALFLQFVFTSAPNDLHKRQFLTTNLVETINKKATN